MYLPSRGCAARRAGAPRCSRGRLLARARCTWRAVPRTWAPHAHLRTTPRNWPLFSLKRLDPDDSGRKIPAIWHWAGANPGVFTPETQRLDSSRRFVVRTVFAAVRDRLANHVASRSGTPAKLQYEPRVGILQHGIEYAPLNTACWPAWLPPETQFLPQKVESTSPGQHSRSLHQRATPAPC